MPVLLAYRTKHTLNQVTGGVSDGTASNGASDIKQRNYSRENRAREMIPTTRKHNDQYDDRFDDKFDIFAR